MGATPKAGTSWQSVREPPHEKEEEQASYTLVTQRKGEGKRGAVCQRVAMLRKHHLSTNAQNFSTQECLDPGTS